MSTTTIPLETPIKRGETEIKSIDLRKPASGELRGVSLRALLDMEINAINLVLPRITSPSLTEIEVARMDPVDTLQAGVAIAGFLMPRRALEEAEAALKETSPFRIQ